MLKKLRIKFIALNMATVAVVLAVIFSAICVINYQQSVASVHEAMSNAIAFTESKSRALTDGDTQGPVSYTHLYWQSGTAIAAESHFPIHVDFKPSAAAWAGKVDNLHENPFRITSPETKIK